MATAKHESKRSGREKDDERGDDSSCAKQTHAGTKEKQRDTKMKAKRDKRERRSCSCSLTRNKDTCLVESRAGRNKINLYHLPISSSICAFGALLSYLIIRVLFGVCDHERKSYRVYQAPGISLSFNIVPSTYYHSTYSYQTKLYRTRMYAERALRKST